MAGDLNPSGGRRSNADEADRASGADEDPGPDEGWRTTQNLAAAIALILLLAAGLWVVDALVRTKRALDCLQAGRSRCPGIEAPR